MLKMYYCLYLSALTTGSYNHISVFPELLAILVTTRQKFTLAYMGKSYDPHICYLSLQNLVDFSDKMEWLLS
ncbi:hypothetical protein NIES4071_54950 [Calothrix sp. NIES-4071]|nr:hypothetical protein NIES4071_54950 [Calothrix sp. NIES-4071]BAZ59802.1 hypothetical protein NIES4105_54900 [Calothrix sp. NIES-4105]